MSKKVLHLTLERKWFDQIARGEKLVEYRELKAYWYKRLTYMGSKLKFKEFDEIHFRNGYGKDSPFMRVKYLCTEIKFSRFNIYLGDILEIKNWK